MSFKFAFLDSPVFYDVNNRQKLPIINSLPIVESTCIIIQFDMVHIIWSIAYVTLEYGPYRMNRMDHVI